MDGHGIDVGVIPIATGFHAVDNDAGGGVAPFLKVATAESLVHAHIHYTIIGTAPIVARGTGEADGAVGEGDIVEPTGSGVITETGVGDGDSAHHVGHSGSAVPTVAPSKGGVGPVDSQHGLVATSTYPIENVGGCDSGLSRSGGAIGVAGR